MRKQMTAFFTAKLNPMVRMAAMLTRRFGGSCPAVALLGALFFCQVPAGAATIMATSGSLTEVSNAVASASPGDTVVMPAGTNAWTATLTITNGIHLRGLGTNRTVLIDEVPRVNNGVPMIVVTPIPNFLSELTQFTIQAGVINTAYNYHGDIAVGGTGTPLWRIDNVEFNEPYAKAIIVYGSTYGLIDHCTFIMQAEGIIAYGDGYGDNSWSTPVNYGSSNALYIEDNYFTNVIGAPAGVFDGYGGARMVFRHNVVYNDFLPNHGTESSQRYRGTRSFEIYDNQFTWNANPWSPYYTAIQLRSGTGVIYSNTASGYTVLVTINNYRNTDPYPPFGGVTGFNPWDSNSPTLFLSGTHTGTNNSPALVVSTAKWTVNQWTGYTVNDTNTGRYCLIVGNTSNTMIMEYPKDLAPITFATGDHFTIYHCYPALDQVGVGSGDLLVGDGPPYGPLYNATTGTNTWPHQISEPLYAWGNSLNGANNEIGSGYPNILANRDFFNDTAKPGYTPFTYPHPLTGATNPVTVLAPPQNLQVVPIVQ